jgi:ubiquinone/menaquinone biosynthesis C-methylase UbiE
MGISVTAEKSSALEFGSKADGFEAPVQLPRDNSERRAWQDANKSWWEASPMRYDWREEIGADPGTEAYFREIDRRFFSSAAKYMPWRELPFDNIIPFDDLGSKDVLELGVGQGTHAQLIAPRCKSFTGIDLTSHAANMTSRRFRVFGTPGNVVQMDAEEMTFADGSFDYVWSWGVIHHSADTRRVLQEVHRVLRPSGVCTVMIYYRSWWSFYVCGFLRRTFQSQFRKQGNLHHVIQAATDGAIARHYLASEWTALAGQFFRVERITIYGQKSDILPLPRGMLKRSLESVIPDSFGRLLTNRMRMGAFLVATMRKE